MHHDLKAQHRAVRVVSVQMATWNIKTPEEFYDKIDSFVDIACGYRADFVVFPEHFTVSLLALQPPKTAREGAEFLTGHTQDFCTRLSALAADRNINIIGGSHTARNATGAVRNTSFVFLRDGAVHAREKLHPTPDEKSEWGITGGTSADVIETDCGPIGIAICYDSEFPEMSRHLVDQGARVLFVPYCTDTRHGHFRVRYCCAARTVENQCFVVTAGLCGNLHGVVNIDINHAQSAILTPSDHPFARDGVAAEASENIETAIVADLDFARLDWARESGSVQNLKDRRLDLYGVEWRGD